MTSDIANACLPAFTALAVCGVLLVVLIRCSRLHWSWRRWRSLAGDEHGGVQSLAFVMTFPVFLLLLLFVVQLSQLVIALGVVQYSSFAAARAASVWIAADVNDQFRSLGGDSDSQNELPAVIPPGSVLTLSQETADVSGGRKLREIWTAAALACVPIAPSGSRGIPTISSTAAGISSSLTLVVQSLDPSARNNARMPARIAHKVAYSFANTFVDLRFEDRTNRPLDGEVATYNPLGDPSALYLPSEVGWRDPIIATVRHRFALMPGPGRWLAAGVANGDGRIILENGVYKTTVTGMTTMTLEGLQSLRPTVHPAME